MIEIEGIEYRTSAQWERKRRHVRKGQLGKGVERSWRSPDGNVSATFYAESQTRPWSKKDIAAAKRERREATAAKREEAMRKRIERDIREDQHLEDLYLAWGVMVGHPVIEPGEIKRHTAHQWCVLGFVPIADARWRVGLQTLAKSDGRYSYLCDCGPWDVRYDPDRAKELLEIEPMENGDGCPWW